MATKHKHRGPLSHQILIAVFAVILTWLFFHFLEYVMGDISTIGGPNLAEVLPRFQDKDLLARSARLAREQQSLEQQRSIVNARQHALEASTQITKETMDQLFEIQRSSAQRGVKITEAERRAFADNKRRFLANQSESQQLNQEMEQLEKQLSITWESNRKVYAELEKQARLAGQELQSLQHWHEWKKAALKLLFLMPLLVLACRLFRTRKSTVTAPLIYAAGVALLAELYYILDEYFPERFFKYLVIGVAIALTAQILVYLLRMLVTPRKDWLLKQYRQAYEKFQCPVCAYPIRRGPLRYAFWSEKTLKKQVLSEPHGSNSDETYSCPNCGAALHEKCETCQMVRHALLPHCEKCGATKEVEFPGLEPAQG